MSAWFSKARQKSYSSAGDLSIVIAGWITVTGAVSLAVTSEPAGGWPVTVATLVNEACSATVVQV